MKRDLIDSAICASKRSIRAITASTQLSAIDGARLARTRLELGIESWCVARRNGVWVCTLSVEWFGPSQECATIVGEGHDPLAAERDAFWFLARFYATRAHDLNDACRKAVAA